MYPIVDLARYNKWFNARLSLVLQELGNNKEVLRQLNHIHVMDCLWLSRLGYSLKELAPPTNMLEVRFFNARSWYRKQKIADEQIALSAQSLNGRIARRVIEFTTMSDLANVRCTVEKAYAAMFTHQALHRGEILSELQRCGLTFGQSDLLPFIIDSGF
jgi:uncharacterized damage-inducible protein DinB